MSFCEILKDLRAERGVTQKEVALACGLTPTCICQLENGSRSPTGSTIRALAIYYGCSANYLLELDEYGGVISPVISPTASSLSAEENQLIKKFRDMRSDLRAIYLGMADTLLQTPESLAGNTQRKKGADE